MRSVKIVEIDVPRCQLTYGTAPCTAELGVTGSIKCFNTARTCQDRENYDEGTATLRFIRPDAHDDDYDAIPSLNGVDITPAVIEPGLSLGKRESLSISFLDHPDSDVKTDPYFAERSYNPFEQGTFWGKLRARIPSLRGAPLRLYRGEQGQAVSAMTVRHHMIETIDGPSGGRFRIKAKDPLKFLDGDRAQAPSVTPGILAAAIDEDDTTVTLEPTGVGDEHYPAEGKVAIAGSEICAFTRIGDVLTLTRGQSGTTPESHDQFDGVQLVLVYDGESPADIIYDLITEFTDVDPTWIPLTDWQTEMTQYINRLYSAEIAEPTAVRDLVDELIEQVGLVMWSDLTVQRINLTALRPVSSSAALYDEDRILERSFSSKEQLDKRVSQVWTYIGLRNPLAELDDRSNYQSVVVRIDDTGADEEYGGQPAIKKIYSRWITSFNRTAASRLNELVLSRYRDPPRLIGFDVFRTDTAPRLGRGLNVNHYELQADTGANPNVSAQVVSLEAMDDRYVVEAEELDFSLEDDEKIVFIDSNDISINLRDLYDSIYGPPSTYDKVTFIIEGGVYIGTPWRDYNPAPLPDEEARLQNPDFEDGNTGWTFFGVGSSSIEENPVAFNGTWVATLGLTSNPNDNSGSWINDGRSPASEGEGAGFSVRVRSPGGWGSLADAPWIRAVINWYDAGDSFLAETTGPLVYGYDVLNEWGEARVVGQAPAGAETYTLRVQAAYGDGGFYIDAARSLDDELYAVTVGEWPEEPDLCLINNGEIRAGGGRGGDYSAGNRDGIDGARGLHTRVPIEIENNGVIAGGGGGGGGWSHGIQGGGGGGGAGYSEDGLGNQTFAPGGDGLFPEWDGGEGTVETGGIGGGTLSGEFADDGGDGGEDGDTPAGASSPGTGGEGGWATDGDSFITFTVEGTILGPRMN